MVDISDLKRTKAALGTVEIRLKRALRGSQDGLWKIDLVTNTNWYGEGFAALLGYTPGELPTSREGFLTLIHPEDVESVKASVASHLEHRTAHDMEFRVRHKAGTTNGFAGAGKPAPPPTARRCASPARCRSSPIANWPSRPS